MIQESSDPAAEPTSLEQYLIEAAEHALRAHLMGADPYWIRSCARLQVLGQERTAFGANESAACTAMLATMESTLAGQRILFPA